MSKEDIVNCLKIDMSQREIASMFGVSQTTVKYHIKKLGLDKKTNRYREDGLRCCTSCKIEKTKDEFYRKNKTTDKILSICKKCNIRQLTEKRRKFKKECVDYKGGKCVKCDYDKSLSALEFHHRNPNEKDFSISETTKRKLEEVLDELDKCDLVCSNCHKEIHEELYLREE